MFKIIIKNSKGIHQDWPGNYKTEKAAEHAAHGLRIKFKKPFWRAYYIDIEPRVVKK